MQSQLDSLQRVFDSLVRPIEDRLASRAAAIGPRGGDPVWQLGHAAFDAAHALIVPFCADSSLPLRFGHTFHGMHVGDPWPDSRPAYSDVRSWWSDILREGRRSLEHLEPTAQLRAPVAFTALTVSTVTEACDYVLFHTAFHLGRAYELLKPKEPDESNVSA